MIFRRCALNCLAAFWGLLTFAPECLSQFPSGADASCVISCRIDRWSGDWLIFYHKFKNLVGSPQPVEAIDIETGLTPGVDSTAIFEIPASHWDGSFSVPGVKPPQFRRSTVEWTSPDTVATLDELDLPNQHQLLPGDSILLIVRSKALPTIVRSWATGWTKPITGTEYDSLVELGFRPRKWYKDASERITIGPSSDLFSTHVLTFIDSLTYFVDRSRSEGWILSQATSDSYSRLYTSIKNDVGQFALRSARARIDTVLQQANIDSSSTLTSEAYGLIRFNTEYLRDKLNSTGEVKGGVLMPSSAILSVKAKPSVGFGRTDTLRCIVATVRWPAACNVSLGTVTGAYGFAKYGSDTTVGKYRYQKFRTTTAQALSWSAGAEYDLFSVSLSGSCDAGIFELTNALSGGEWFVDVNYLDKTDPVLY